MITLEDDVLAANAIAVAGAGAGKAAGMVADVGLLATFSTRLHCRKPMQRVDQERTSLDNALLVDGQRPIALPNRTSEEVVTYRCMCGFTMDAPPVALGLAAAS